MDTELKIYVVVRADLEIPAGKLGVQIGHAVLGSYLASTARTPSLAEAYRRTALQLKICIRAKNLAALERAEQECKDLAFPTFKVTDVARTVFTEPTVTALGIGPVREEDLPKYVRRMQLF